MFKVLKFVLIVGGVLLLALAAGLMLQAPWATAVWPWPDGRLSYTFVAAIQAAIAAAMIWIGVSEEWGALAAGGLNLLVTMTGTAVYFFILAGRNDDATIRTFAIGCALFALFNLGLFLWSRRIPIRDPCPTPRPVLFSFGLFAAVLILVAGALLLRLANIFPWPLNPDTAVVFGFIFLGDAFYFLYGLWLPRWHTASAPLWSFLAYDLVLIGPFLAHFSKVQPELRLSLILYTAVLLYSGGLAIYYLLINRATRSLNAVSN